MKRHVWSFGIFYFCISLAVVAAGIDTPIKQFAGAGSSSVTVCYNSTDDQYLAAWFDGPLNFSILNATGARIVRPTPITLAPDIGLFGEPFCLYNAIDNQYCITWIGSNSDTQIANVYFIIINADGTLATQATAIPNVALQPTANYSSSWVTHNPFNDQYLFTWLAITADAIANPAFAIYSAQGTSVVPTTIIHQDPLFNTSTYPIFSSYNGTDNQYFITWMAIDAAESAYAYFIILDHNGRVVVPYARI